MHTTANATQNHCTKWENETWLSNTVHSTRTHCDTAKHSKRDTKQGQLHTLRKTPDNTARNEMGHETGVSTTAHITKMHCNTREDTRQRTAAHAKHTARNERAMRHGSVQLHTAHTATQEGTRYVKHTLQHFTMRANTLSTTAATYRLFHCVFSSILSESCGCIE